MKEKGNALTQIMHGTLYLIGMLLIMQSSGLFDAVALMIRSALTAFLPMH